MSVDRMHRFLATGAVLLAATVAAAPAASAATHRPPHRARHTIHHVRVDSHRGSGIPQHNGGDRDADNNGGPSDGDGGV
jgi:Spy/CpxP family protein refolding chaperone